MFTVLDRYSETKFAMPTGALKGQLMLHLCSSSHQWRRPCHESPHKEQITVSQADIFATERGRLNKRDHIMRAIRTSCGPPCRQILPNSIRGLGSRHFSGVCLSDCLLLCALLPRIKIFQGSAEFSGTSDLLAIRSAVDLPRAHSNSYMTSDWREGMEMQHKSRAVISSRGQLHVGGKSTCGQ